MINARTGVESIREMSWQSFEQLVGEAYKRQGYTVHENGGGGPDGGIDLFLIQDGRRTIMQGKHWKTNTIGVSPVRELYGVMMAENASACIFVSSGTYTSEAIFFAKDKPITLVDGDALYVMIAAVQNTSGLPNVKTPITVRPSSRKSVQPTIQPSDLLARRSSDKLNPTLESNPDALLKPAYICPVCTSQMVKRVVKKGGNAGNAFMGCLNYPKCRGTLPV